jgi:hypothetical protein
MIRKGDQVAYRDANSDWQLGNARCTGFTAKGGQEVLLLDNGQWCYQRDVVGLGELTRIVNRVRDILYLDTGGYSPDKQWDAETIEAVAGVIEDAGLAPRAAGEAHA